MKSLIINSNYFKHSTPENLSVYTGVNLQPYFEHHGRLGMKWGKRNGPPYPLDYSKLSEEERAKDKERVKAEGDIESVGYKKNRSYFTDQEINEVINRYQLNTRINQLAADSVKMKAGKSKVDQLKDNLQTVSDVGFKLGSAIQAGSNIYNHVAKIMNAFGDADMPIIGEKKQKESKINKLSKLELDKYIANIDKLQGTLSNNEVKELVQRANQIKQLQTMRDGNKADADISNLEKGNKQAELLNKRAELGNRNLELMNQRAELQDQARKRSEAIAQANHEKIIKQEAQRRQQQIQQEAQRRQAKEAERAKKTEVDYDPSASQKALDNYTKAVKEAREADYKWRKSGDDLDRREAAVKDAKLERATKEYNEQVAKDKQYKPTSSYSTVEKWLHKNDYDKSVEVEKRQREYANEQQRKRIEAEERAIEEERRKRGQAYIEYYI